MKEKKSKSFQLEILENGEWKLFGNVFVSDLGTHLAVKRIDEIDKKANCRIKQGGKIISKQIKFF